MYLMNASIQTLPMCGAKLCQSFRYPTDTGTNNDTQKGLSFVPTATDAKPMENMKDFNIFANKSKRKLRRMINPPRPGDEPALFRNSNETNTSTDSQTLGSKVLEDAFEAIRLNITNMEQCPTRKHNLTRKEKQALNELASNKNLIINKVDRDPPLWSDPVPTTSTQV